MIGRTTRVQPEMQGYVEYEKKGYSLKQTIGVMFTGICSLGIVLIFGFIVIRMFTSLDEEVIRAAAIVFLFGTMGVFFAAAGLGLAVVYRYVAKPGVQMPGRLGEIEQKLGLD